MKQLTNQETGMQAIQAWFPSASPVVVHSAHAALVSPVFGDAITRKVGTKPVPSGFKRGPS